MPTLTSQCRVSTASVSSQVTRDVLAQHNFTHCTQLLQRLCFMVHLSLEKILRIGFHTVFFPLIYLIRTTFGYSSFCLFFEYVRVLRTGFMFVGTLVVLFEFLTRSYSKRVMWYLLLLSCAIGVFQGWVIKTFKRPVCTLHNHKTWIYCCYIKYQQWHSNEYRSRLPNGRPNLNHKLTLLGFFNFSN